MQSITLTIEQKDPEKVYSEKVAITCKTVEGAVSLIEGILLARSERDSKDEFTASITINKEVEKHSSLPTVEVLPPLEERHE